MFVATTTTIQNNKNENRGVHHDLGSSSSYSSSLAIPNGQGEYCDQLHHHEHQEQNNEDHHDDQKDEETNIIMAIVGLLPSRSSQKTVDTRAKVQPQNRGSSQQEKRMKNEVGMTTTIKESTIKNNKNDHKEADDNSDGLLRCAIACEWHLENLTDRLLVVATLLLVICFSATLVALITTTILRRNGYYDD